MDRAVQPYGMHAVRMSERPVLPLLAMGFFVLTFVIKAFTDGPYIRGEVSQAVVYSKYVTAAVACAFALMGSIGRRKRVFCREFRDLMVIVTVFTIASVFMQLLSDKFSTNVTIELVKLAMPIVLAYSMLNILSESELYRCMVAVLIVCLAGYIVELRTQGISISSVFSASLDEGNSSTESSGFSDIALMLTFYFAFFGGKKLPLIVSAAFTVLAFKRLAMLVAVIVLVIGLFRPGLERVRVRRGAITFLKVATLALTALWVWMLLPEQQSLFVSFFGRTPLDFTMGRSESLRYLWLSNFQSYGYGSANETINALFGVPFEMDLAKIAFELTPLATVLFVWLFWNVAGMSLWGVLIVGYYMLNMITSDSLTSNFAFTIAYMVIGAINQLPEFGGCGAEKSRVRGSLKGAFHAD